VTSTPVLVEASDGHRPCVLDASLGAYHSAVITEGGVLWTWGWGGSFWQGYGALGHGRQDNLALPTMVEQFVRQGEEISQVACGDRHTIVLTSDGRVYSTGIGEFGRLGLGDSRRDEIKFEQLTYFKQSSYSVLTPGGLSSIVKIGAGSNYSAALSEQGELWVWGKNDYGQLGLTDEAKYVKDAYSRYPRLVRALPMEGHAVVDFACGDTHMLALTSSGAIYEWGNRNHFEPYPVTLPSRYADGLKDICKLAAGDGTSFALTGDGALYHWKTRPKDPSAGGVQVVAPARVPGAAFGGDRVLDIAASGTRCAAVTAIDDQVR